MFKFLNSNKKVATVAANLFFGVDRNKYVFLGTRDFYYTDKGSHTDRYYAYGFVNPNDLLDRRVVLPYAMNDGYKTHPYYLNCILPWSLGSNALYGFANHNHSEWLENYMINNFNSVWCDKTNWWVPASDQEKYDRLVSTQQNASKPNDPPKTSAQDNVIFVNFKEKTQ